jgi:hypothetical protein
VSEPRFRNLEHDWDLPASPCSRFVTSYHLISQRHVNVRSTGDPWGRSLARSEQSEVPGQVRSIGKTNAPFAARPTRHNI